MSPTCCWHGWPRDRASWRFAPLSVRGADGSSAKCSPRAWSSPALAAQQALLVARWTLPALVSLAPAGVPRLESAGLIQRCWRRQPALVLFSTLIVGALPAWHATRRQRAQEKNLATARGRGTVRSSPGSGRRSSAAQAALVLIVLACAALLIRSAINLQHMPVGFDTTGVAHGPCRPSWRAVSRARSKSTRRFRDILDRVEAAPGVQVAALDSQPPLLAAAAQRVGAGGQARSLRIGSTAGRTSLRPTISKYLRIPLKAGRALHRCRYPQAPLVMVINETLAREASARQNRSASGWVAAKAHPDNPMWKTVVGVVRRLQARGPAEMPAPEFYIPVAQIPDVAWAGRATISVVARGTAPAALASAIRSAVRRADPALPVFGLTTMERWASAGVGAGALQHVC